MIDRKFINVEYIGIGTATIHFGIAHKENSNLSLSIAFSVPEADFGTFAETIEFNATISPNLSENLSSVEDFIKYGQHTTALATFVREAKAIVAYANSRNAAFHALVQHFDPEDYDRRNGII